MKYAWAWFQYHADQRLKAFNFYLVFVGVMSLAYGTALKEGLAATPSKQGHGSASAKDESVVAAKAPKEQVEQAGANRQALLLFAMALSLVGCLMSAAFLMVEVRNKELVDSGGFWLDILESRLRMTIREDSNTIGARPFFLGALAEWKGFLPGWQRLYSHQVALRGIYFIVGVIFMLAFFYALHLSILP